MCQLADRQYILLESGPFLQKRCAEWRWDEKVSCYPGWKGHVKVNLSGFEHKVVIIASTRLWIKWRRIHRDQVKICKSMFQVEAKVSSARFVCTIWRKTKKYVLLTETLAGHSFMYCQCSTRGDLLVPKTTDWLVYLANKFFHHSPTQTKVVMAYSDISVNLSWAHGEKLTMAPVRM